MVYESAIFHMMVAYLGFSNICGGSHRGATHSGIAQSDFTCSLLSELISVKYFICVDNNDKTAKSTNNIPITLRVGRLNNLLDSISVYRKIKKEGPFKKIIIYHSLLFFPLILLFRISGKKFTLQVNEVFSRAGSHNSFIHFVIEKMMFYLASDFILAASPLAKYLPQSATRRLNHIPLVPGPIFVPEHAVQNNPNLHSKVCRLVYAGVIDRKKVGGAFIVVQLAMLLNNLNYSVDIYGFGTEIDIGDLKRQIEKCNFESKTKVRYMGSLPHEELIQKLSNYDVGVAAQYIGTNFSASSFPSKILTYLSAGLHTISASSASVNAWQFRESIYIYSDSSLADLVLHIKSLGPIDKNIGRKNVGLIRNSMLASLGRLIG